MQGYRAIKREAGPAGLLKLTQHVGSGRGGYSREQLAIVDRLSVGALFKEIPGSSVGRSQYTSTIISSRANTIRPGNRALQETAIEPLRTPYSPETSLASSTWKMRRTRCTIGASTIPETVMKASPLKSA
jgi:hypothetical protein